MFACICRAVTGDDVSEAIDGGAATVAAVARATGACTMCGMCKDRLRGMLGEPGQPRPAAVAPAALPPPSAAEEPLTAMVRVCAETIGPSSS